MKKNRGGGAQKLVEQEISKMSLGLLHGFVCGGGGSEF